MYRSFARLTRAVLVSAAAIAAIAACAPAAQAKAGTCTELRVPVSLGPRMPSDQRLFVKLCLPNRQSAPDTVQVLVPGMTYNHTYWDLPDPTGGGDRYSYVESAGKAGYATAAVDRLGTGQSSHPLSLLSWNSTSAWALHQLMQKLRNGIEGPKGTVRFKKVVLVGHSLGSSVVWLAASRYHADMDGVIITGATHQPRYDSVSLILTHLYPAMLDPQFSSKGLDPGYVTTEPGTREQHFWANGDYDRALVEWDEDHKDVGNLAEFAEAGKEFLAEPLDIRSPVLLALGRQDVVYCGGPLPIVSLITKSQCSSGAALAKAERPVLGPRVPSVDGYVLSNSGHDLNGMRNAGRWFDVANAWVDKHVGGRAERRAKTVKKAKRR